MKLHWWIAGVVFVVASGVIVLKCYTESKEKFFCSVDNSNKMNYTKSQADLYGSDFECTEFII